MIAKKVLIDPAQFDRIVRYIRSHPPQWHELGEALAIDQIVQSVIISDITITETEDKQNNT